MEPFFFEVDGKPSYVTGERYREMIKNHLIPQMKRHRSFSRAIFQQDGAPPHTAQETKELLQQQFGAERIISKGFPFEWPPYSPDLSPCDYWVWNFLKSQVYHPPLPKNLVELKQRIRDACSAITPDLLTSATHSILKRLHLCENMLGGHLEHVL
jgi:hypothetical protein